MMAPDRWGWAPGWSANHSAWTSQGRASSSAETNFSSLRMSIVSSNPLGLTCLTP